MTASTNCIQPSRLRILFVRLGYTGVGLIAGYLLASALLHGPQNPKYLIGLMLGAVIGITHTQATAYKHLQVLIFPDAVEGPGSVFGRRRQRLTLSQLDRNRSLTTNLRSFFLNYWGIVDLQGNQIVLDKLTYSTSQIEQIRAILGIRAN